ncbi:O-antigen ligase family protein [Nocardioides albidus]|uniref:O-antigen ligase family protein n=1 Tax=Nocardioides albidus TaxID=1517589 RepID=A0A5C4W9W0_9ACTN|nr:O-antigen ligase family protein [Nocardioides albidus]TNM45074.1 O-antigen ligase family protein [Nocardioides albidus]
MSPEQPASAVAVERGIVRLAPLVFGVLLAALAGLQAPRAEDRLLLLQFALVIGVVGLTALLLLRVSRRPIRLPGRLWSWLVLILASGSVSMAMSPSPVDALPRAALYAALVLLAVAVYGIAKAPTWSLAPWLCAIVASSGAFVLVALVDMAPHLPPFQGQHVGTFVNVRRMAAVAFLVAAAAGGLGLLNQRLRVAAVAGTALMLVVIMASGSRGPLLAWLLFAGIVILLSRRGRRRTFLVDALVAFLLAAAAVSTLHVSGAWQTPNVFVRVATTAAADGEGFSSGRVELWHTAVDDVWRAPWFGRGPDAFALVEPMALVLHPHNVVLQLLMEFGVVGVLLLLGLAARSLLRAGARRVWQGCRRTRSGQLLSAILVAQAALAMIDGPLYWLPALAQFAVCAGLWCAVVTDHQD